MKIRIAINGLGRIGRALIRAIIELDYQDIEIVAANGPASIDDHAHLLKYDSIHGLFNANIEVIDQNYLQINQQKIKILAIKEPSQLPWSALGVDIVLECSGKFNTKQQAIAHLRAGAKRVLVSAPCEDADSTIIYQVNNQALKANHRIISVGSCTTNALAPLLKVLHDNLVVESAFMTTIHSYTNDQNILDASHKDLRRARAGCLSMIPTSTGAAKAIGLVIPELDKKIDGAAIRVPTPNVSLIDLSFNVTKPTSKVIINELMKVASKSQLSKVLAIAPNHTVSVDFNHNSYSSIFDPSETKVINQNFGRIISWYDNEWGFSVRMLDVLRLLK